jgi:hypothetical protein
MLVFIPLALVCIICFSKNGFSQHLERKGNIVTWRGNTIELSISNLDTIIVIDPVTGKEETIVEQRDPEPIKINGQSIPSNLIENNSFTGSDKDLRTYLLKNLRNELGALEDGTYDLNISDILIDENGRIVYFNFPEVKRIKSINDINPKSGTTNTSDPNINVPAGAKKPTVPGKKENNFNRINNNAFYETIRNADQQAIFNKILDLLGTAPVFIPAKLDGKNVISKYNTSLLFLNNFKIKDHKVFEINDDGTYQEI